MGITKILAVSKTVLRSIRTCFSVGLQKSNRTTMVVHLASGDKIFSYFLSPFWSMIGALLIGLVIGALLGLILSLFVLFAEFLFYRFYYKRRFPNASWTDYLEYRNNSNSSYHVLQLRGGAFTLEDLLLAEAIENSTNSINPILNFISQQCFRRPGFYRLNLERWQNAIEALDKVGLVKWFLYRGRRIGIIAFDLFLLQALKLSSLTIPVWGIGHVSLGIYEFSKTKMLFNIIGLVSILSLGAGFGILSLTQFLFMRFGFSTLSNILAKYAASSAVGLISAISVYSVGQFTLPDCENFGTYLDDINMNIKNGKIKIPLMELDNTDVLLHVPESINGLEVIDPSGDIIPNTMETLGSLFKEPYFQNYVPRSPQMKTFEQIVEKTDFSPSSSPIDVPVFQKIKENAIKVLEDDAAF